MILYHGSNRTVTEPKLQTDAAKKELGSGFYLTPDSAQAAAAARTRVRREQRLLEKKSDYDRGVVSTFELDENRSPEGISVRVYNGRVASICRSKFQKRCL